jgi:hypothetical protein
MSGFKAFMLLAAAPVMRDSRAKWSASAVLAAMLFAPSHGCMAETRVSGWALPDFKH